MRRIVVASALAGLTAAIAGAAYAVPPVCIERDAPGAHVQVTCGINVCTTEVVEKCVR